MRRPEGPPLPLPLLHPPPPERFRRVVTSRVVDAAAVVGDGGGCGGGCGGLPRQQRDGWGIVLPSPCHERVCAAGRWALMLLGRCSGDCPSDSSTAVYHIVG